MDSSSSSVPQDILCDICRKVKATRWFKFTSATVCNSPACYEEHQRRWDLIIAEHGDE